MLVGNARYVKNLFEKILENQALRLASNGNSDRGALLRITGEEVWGVRCQVSGSRIVFTAFRPQSERGGMKILGQSENWGNGCQKMSKQTLNGG